MNRTNDPRAILSTRRTIQASAEAIFDAFADPAKLARWWGPAGFTNTFETFEFVPGGRWVFVMHGPDGADYANECNFREIRPGQKVVIEHVCAPLFQLTIELSAQGDSTLLTWDQEFETVEMADRVKAICEPANDQNLDRLEMVLGIRPNA